MSVPRFGLYDEANYLSSICVFGIVESVYEVRESSEKIDWKHWHQHLSFKLSGWAIRKILNSIASWPSRTALFSPFLEERTAHLSYLTVRLYACISCQMNNCTPSFPTWSVGKLCWSISHSPSKSHSQNLHKKIKIVFLSLCSLVL
jgi:hypothetical protein